MQQKYIVRSVEALIGISFFVPLLMVPAHFIFPFIVPKVLLLRSLVLIMLGGWLLLLVTNWEDYKVRLTPISIAVSLFFLSFSISTFVGVDWYHSFWDNHERMLGLFTIIHYVLYYFIVTSVVKEWRDWQWLIRIFLLAGALVMLLGCIQRIYPYIRPDSPPFLLNQSGSRVASTLGNPIYVGGYGLFLFFLGLLSALKEKRQSWKLYAFGGAFLGMLGVFFSGTRGSVLGLIAGALVLGVIYTIHMKSHPQARTLVLRLMAAGVMILAILFAFRHSSFVRSIPALGDLLNTSLAGTSTTRLMAWGIAFDAWKDRPLFGWGPNNFYYAFNTYYRPEFLEHGWAETWFDNAHNIIMNTLAVQGAVGLIFYLALFATVFWSLWRSYQAGRLDIHIAVVSMAFFVAHLVQNIFVFENPTSYLYFFFMLAFVNSQRLTTGSEKVDKSSIEHQGEPASIGFCALVGFVMLLLIYATDINPARANMETLALLQSLYTVQNPADQYQRTSSIPSPHIDDIRNDFARTVSQVLGPYVSNGHEDQARQLLGLALDELKKNRALHPTDIRVHLLQSQLDEQGASLFHDAGYLIDSEATLTDALRQSPKRQQIQYTLAVEKLALQKNDEAIALMQQSVDEDPKISEGWWRLATIYREAHRLPEAQAVVRKARSLGVAFDDRGLGVVNGILPPEATGTAK